MARDEREFAALVDRLKHLESARVSLACLLDERHPAYEQRSAAAVVRMRGWVLVALAEVGVTDEELEFVLEELDNGNDAYLVAAAARALCSYPGLGKQHEDVVERAMANIRDHDDALSFDTYGGYSDKRPFATAMGELQKALELIAKRQQPPTCCCSGGRVKARAGTPDNRLPTTRFEDHAGTQLDFAEVFTGKPSIVVFFYTRCTNPNKCSLTITRLAELQSELSRRGLDQRIRTAAITYDPQFDGPEALTQYTASRGVRLGPDHRGMRSIAGADAMNGYFDLGVSYNGSIVSRHRVELCVLDARGRIAARFDRLLWKEHEVIDAAVRALHEEEPPASPPAPPKQAGASKATPAAAVAGALLSVATAFFPKCPMCWAAYLSAFGIAGLGGVQYSPWLLPVFATLMVANLYGLFPRDKSVMRRAAFVLAAVGAFIILVPGLLGQMTFAPILGVSLTIGGSLLSVVGSMRRADFQAKFALR